MKAAFWFCIAVGLFIFALAAWGRAAASGAAIGVFFILLGFIGFVHLRIAKLEETLKQTKRKDGLEG